MVVGELYVLWSCLGPAEADAPLLVDSDAVLSRPVAAELFEPVARRDAQIASTPVPQTLGVTIGERANHLVMLPRCVSNVKRQYRTV